MTLMGLATGLLIGLAIGLLIGLAIGLLMGLARPLSGPLGLLASGVSLCGPLASGRSLATFGAYPLIPIGAPKGPPSDPSRGRTWGPLEGTSKGHLSPQAGLGAAHTW